MLAGRSSRVRVLIVDDSALMRFSLRTRLGEDPELEIVGEARDGEQAVELAERLRPDVITLDVELPRLNGLEALTAIMQTCPTPVVMVSSLTQANAATTIEALERGAVDFVGKPSILTGTGLAPVVAEVAHKIKVAASARPRCGSAETRWRRSSRPVGALAGGVGRRGLVVIGTSTGGPRALGQVVPRLPADFPAPVVVVQHMPAGFTRALAQRLDGLSALQVKEAETGERLRAGLVLIAPGGRHVKIADDRTIRLTDEPPFHGVRPAVDPTMQSGASVFRSATIGVILTGMGIDGRAGAMMIKRAGGVVLAESEESCTIYGMPRAVIDAGLADVVVPLDAIVDELGKMV